VFLTFIRQTHRVTSASRGSAAHMHIQGPTSQPAARSILDKEAASALRSQAPRTLRAILRVMTVAIILWGIGVAAVFPNKVVTATMLGTLLAATLAARQLIRKNRVTQAAITLLGAWSIVSGAIVVFSGGLRSPCLYMPLIPTIVAALILGRRALTISVGLLVLFCTSLLAMDLMSAWPTYSLQGPPWALWVTHCVTLGVVCVIVGEAVVGLGRSLAGQKLEIEGRRQAERSLRESELRLSAVINNCPAVACQWFDASGKVILWNQASEKIFGYTSEEAMGKSLGDLILTPETAEQFRKELETIAATGNPQGPDEFEFRRKDGTKGRCLSTVFAIPGDGPTPWFVCMDIDVTEHKLAEERLRQTQKLRAIGQLAGGVAHDFNNLLTVIKGYGSQLHANTTAGTGISLPAVEAILDASERASLLTRQLLTFARQQITEPRVVDLNAEIGQMHTLLRKLVGTSVTLDVVARAENPCLRIDQSQLQQVLMNLAINARDAMPAGGLLRIETRNGTGSDSERILLRVSDTGVGMTPEVRARIFEPFFTTKPAGKGTGLGLATIYGIVEESAGSIEVSSTPGQGTAFTISWPVAPMPKDKPVASVEPRVPGKNAGETILIVEDEPAIRELVTYSLRDRGYNVLGASTGEEGLKVALAYQKPIDLVLTDVVMPKMTGRELAKRLRTELPDTRVVFMSGYSDDDTFRDELEAAQDAFIQKPFTLDVLHDHIQRVIARGK
jgi:two-component system cell cycle sensor histidine kinase/response regulator CckA